MAFDPSDYPPSSLIAMSKNAGKYTTEQAIEAFEGGFGTITADCVPPDELWFVQPDGERAEVSGSRVIVTAAYRIVGKIVGIKP